LKRERGELVNQKDKQLVKDVEKVTNQLESLQRLQRLESLQRLQRLESLERLERLESLQRLERLESLESLESLEKIRIQSSDYRDVVLPDPNDCVIYLDPPYRNTA
jgi:16S rRNA G966 N2-methylase RsmD